MTLKSRFVWWALWQKRYFDTGYNVNNYFKVVALLLGFSFQNIKFALVVGVIYGLMCYVVGYVWIKKGMATRENEISNQLNPFQGEVRKSLLIEPSIGYRD